MKPARCAATQPIPRGDGAARPVRCALVGCGDVAGQYLHTLAASPLVEVLACSDVDPARATALADRHGIGHVLALDTLLGEPEVELVVNLTPPVWHGPIAEQIVAAGKSVYNEKPLALDLDQARRLLDQAVANRVLVGCAPDTFLAPPAQHARRAIHAGVIGTPLAAAAAMLAAGHERWHPTPQGFYR